MLYWMASRAGRFGRPGMAAILGIALALTAVACARSVTHEADGVPYSGFDESGGATYSVIPASTAGIPAYRGEAIARVQTRKMNGMVCIPCCSRKNRCVGSRGKFRFGVVAAVDAIAVYSKLTVSRRGLPWRSRRMQRRSAGTMQ